MRYVKASETRRLVGVLDIVDVCRDAFLAHHRGEVAYSEPRMLTLASVQRYRVKAAALSGLGVAGFRLVAAGRPRAPGDVTRLIVLSDLESGTFVAAIEEQWIYAVRTAAAAYIALEVLAGEPPRTVGVVGTGVIATAFAEIAAASPFIERLVVTSRTSASRDAFLRSVAERSGVRVDMVPDVAAVMGAARAVVLATSARQPVIDASMLRLGTTLYSMGSDELADDVYGACDKLIVDDWQQVQHKADIARLCADGRLGRADVHAELPAIVAGAVRGRESVDETIVVRSEGIASMDVAVAHLVAVRAEVREGA